MPRKPTTIDAYLSAVKGERRSALDALRKTIRTVIPQAEECISYGIPAFRHHAVRTVQPHMLARLAQLDPVKQARTP